MPSSEAVQIPRFENPNAATLRELEETNQIAVLGGLTDSWPAQAEWDIPGLESLLGDTPMEVVTCPQSHMRWDPDAGLDYARIPFRNFLDQMRAEGLNGKRTYLQDDINNAPQLSSQVPIPSHLRDKKLQRLKLWISGKGLITPLHYDPVDTYHWMIRGSKRFVCFRPGVRPFYPQSIRSTGPFVSQIDDAENPSLDEFPRFGEVQKYEVELQSGDVLYLPAFWWHQVASLSDENVSLNYIWFAGAKKNLKYFPQFMRCVPHVARQLRKVARAKKNGETRASGGA